MMELGVLPVGWGWIQPEEIASQEPYSIGIGPFGSNLKVSDYRESVEEQKVLVEELESKLSEADQLDQTLATALQQADALRQSILKKAFSGQLVKQAKNEEPATALLERIRSARATSPAKGRPAKLVSKSLTNY